MRISHLCSVLVFPNAKINLGLHILSKREDGFHELETALLPVGWCDVLEIIPSPDGKFSFNQTGMRIYGPQESNLCVRAWELMKTQHGIGAVHMHLHKVIPSGAGLGGGSADAAFALASLNSIFGLRLGSDALEELAAQLGSDCAFFIRNRFRIATGRGEKFQAAAKPPLPHCLVIVKPRTGVSTADAYRQVTPVRPAVPLAALLKEPVARWKKNLVNDFEATVFKKHPSLLRLKEKLYKMGAVYASMSGSGSAVFGLFDKYVDARTHFRGSTVWQGKTEAIK